MTRISILIGMTACILWGVGCTKKAADTTGGNPGNTQQQPNAANVLTPPGGGAKLEIDDTVKGRGAEAVRGKTLTLQYVGKFTDGKVFDSTLQKGRTPFKFKMGAGQVIPGWDKGVVGMRVGGKRHLVIPPELAYGHAGAGLVIPPDATLIFDIELLKVE